MRSLVKVFVGQKEKRETDNTFIAYLYDYRSSKSGLKLAIKDQILLIFQSVSGQTLTLRRDSSMADRRALSLSFFKKPCGQKQRQSESHQPKLYGDRLSHDNPLHSAKNRLGFYILHLITLFKCHFRISLHFDGIPTWLPQHKASSEPLVFLF